MAERKQGGNERVDIKYGSGSGRVSAGSSAAVARVGHTWTGRAFSQTCFSKGDTGGRSGSNDGNGAHVCTMGRDGPRPEDEDATSLDAI